MTNASNGRIVGLCALVCVIAISARPVSAQQLAPRERLCDPTFEDCRADILTYIQQERVAIDMGFWFMTDARYSNELVNAWNRGVRIRILMDPRCAGSHPACTGPNDQLRAAGIPMRKRVTSGILHWKMILFAGQGQVQFAGANYTPFEMTPTQPYVNFTDEVVFFSNEPAIVHSFMTKFDDLWTSTSEFGNYANVTAPLFRRYPSYAIDPELNFPPDQSYRTRALHAYAAEQQKIDVLMFRITDETHTSAMIGAIGRGLPVRLITDDSEYRNPARLWHAYNVDKMYNAGVQVRVDAHQGINHEKAVILHGSGMTIFGSSNWTSPSSDSQREHNYFTTKRWIYDWLATQFDRKWNNRTGHAETKPFVPLPPDPPVYTLPANGAAGVSVTGLSLAWHAGLWAHNYDIYFGTLPNPPLIEADKRLGPSQHGADYRTYALPALQPGTRYYWKIVSKTMAFVPAEGPVWSFVTAGAAPRRSTVADADGDGRTDLVVFRRSTGTWLTLLSANGYRSSSAVAWGASTDIPLRGDFDGDFKMDRAFYRPSTGTWHILTSGSGFQTSLAIQWGNGADVPLPGDVDGDGRADLIVWRPGTGTWFWLTSSTGYDYARAQLKQWGNHALGDVPMLADMDGDRKMDLMVWRGSTGTWFWLTSSSGYNYAVSGMQQWGSRAAGDVPLAGDLDGDGLADLVAWRPGSGTWLWLKSSRGYEPAAQGLKQWGAFGDTPLLADFDGDGVMDLTIWRPAGGMWFWLTSQSGYAYASAGAQQWGNVLLGDVPVVK